MPFRRTTSVVASLALLIALAPAAAFAAEPHAFPKLTPVRAFFDAPPSLKILVLILLVAMIAAVAVTAQALAGGRRPRGSAFLSSLRLGDRSSA